MKRDPRITKVSPNSLLNLGISGFSTTARPAKKGNSAPNALASGQTTPWGVARVGGPLNGSGRRAWILDTGIDLDHPDLNVDVTNSVSFIAAESADDMNGHGTHVAGIIAARNNDRDVVGVAAGATVVAVKVCNNLPPGDPDSGCPANRVIAGVDYVLTRAQPRDIVNMSIWGPQNLPGMDDVEDAIINAADNGVQFTLISGNAADNANTYSPGRVEHENIWTISAYDDNDVFASFSNYGNPPIEYGAPGVDVPSLWRNGGTHTLDGTSMAAPHVAGLLLGLGEEPVTDGVVSNDPDGNPDLIASSQLATPVVSGSVQGDHPHLSWSAIPRADRYDIYYYTNEPAAGMSAPQKVDETTSISYTASLALHQDRANLPGSSSYTAQFYIIAVSTGNFRTSDVSNTSIFTYWINDGGGGCLPEIICD